jgi:hypothetical protein
MVLEVYLLLLSDVCLEKGANSSIKLRRVRRTSRFVLFLDSYFLVNEVLDVDVDWGCGHGATTPLHLSL